MQKYFLLIFISTRLFAFDPFTDPSYTHSSGGSTGGHDYRDGGREVYDYKGNITYTPPKGVDSKSSNTSSTSKNTSFSIYIDNDFTDNDLIFEIQPNTHLSTIFKNDSTNPLNYMNITTNYHFIGTFKQLQYLLCSGYSKFGRELSNRPLQEFFINKQNLMASIYISTDPPNSKIYIDNSFAGTSNIELISTTSGIHEFKFIDKNGNTTTKNYTILPGKNPSKKITLN